MKGLKCNKFENLLLFNVFKQKRYIKQFNNNFLQDMFDYDVNWSDIYHIIDKASKSRNLSKEEKYFLKTKEEFEK